MIGGVQDQIHLRNGFRDILEVDGQWCADHAAIIEEWLSCVRSHPLIFKPEERLGPRLAGAPVTFPVVTLVDDFQRYLDNKYGKKWDLRKVLSSMPHEIGTFDWNKFDFSLRALQRSHTAQKLLTLFVRFVQKAAEVYDQNASDCEVLIVDLLNEDTPRSEIELLFWFIGKSGLPIIDGHVLSAPRGSSGYSIRTAIRQFDGVKDFAGYLECEAAIFWPPESQLVVISPELRALLQKKYQREDEAAEKVPSAVEPLGPPIEEQRSRPPRRSVLSRIRRIPSWIVAVVSWIVVMALALWVGMEFILSPATRTLSNKEWLIGIAVLIALAVAAGVNKEWKEWRTTQDRRERGSIDSDLTPREALPKDGRRGKDNRSVTDIRKESTSPEVKNEDSDDVSIRKINAGAIWVSAQSGKYIDVVLAKKALAEYPDYPDIRYKTADKLIQESVDAHVKALRGWPINRGQVILPTKGSYVNDPFIDLPQERSSEAYEWWRDAVENERLAGDEKWQIHYLGSLACGLYGRFEEMKEEVSLLMKLKPDYRESMQMNKLGALCVWANAVTSEREIQEMNAIIAPWTMRMTPDSVLAEAEDFLSSDKYNNLGVKVTSSDPLFAAIRKADGEMVRLTVTKRQSGDQQAVPRWNVFPMISGQVFEETTLTREEACALLVEQYWVVSLVPWII